MAKGQKRSNREIKKPKAKKPAAGTAGPKYQLPTKNVPPKDGGK